MKRKDIVRMLIVTLFTLAAAFNLSTVLVYGIDSIATWQLIVSLIIVWGFLEANFAEYGKK